jgi:hypothetical protein
LRKHEGISRIGVDGRCIAMRAAFGALLFVSCLCPSQVNADLPVSLACIADDAYFVWYGTGLNSAPSFGIPIESGQKLAGSRASDPQTRFRIDHRKLFIADASRPEYFYGELSGSLDRYTAGNLTLLLGEDAMTAIAVIADKISTETISLKCIPAG